jgi:hypothetical protein
MSEFRIKHYDGHGRLLKARVLPNAEAVANELHGDYAASVAQECAWAGQNPGKWAEIILGPPELADAVDRFQIQAVL